MAKKVTFEQWQKKCSEHTEHNLGISDLLAPDDPYDVAALMQPAYAAGKSPAEFIEEVFAEDFARLEADEDDWAMSIQED